MSCRSLAAVVLITGGGLAHEDPSGSAWGVDGDAPPAKTRALLSALLRPSYECQSWNRVGVASSDGGYLICEDVPFESADGSSCLIYSFGINDEFEFENEQSDSGCTVHGYDPTVGDTPLHRFHFNKVGLSNVTGHVPGLGPVTTFASMRTKNGDLGQTVGLMKMDIEGGEWPALASMTDGELDQVRQLIVEFHVNRNITNAEELESFARVVRKLRKTFALAHTHLNNYGGVRDLSGVTFPNVYEQTWLNRRELKARALPVHPDDTLAVQTNSPANPLDHINIAAFWDIRCSCPQGQAGDCACAMESTAELKQRLGRAQHAADGPNSALQPAQQ